MRSTNITLSETKRSREIERVGKKLLQAMEHDTFFLNHVKNMSDDVKLDTLFDSFDEMDPTPNNKYVKWLANNYVKNRFRVEDKARVREVLENFNHLKPRLKNYGLSPDINQYDFHSLEEMIYKIKGGDNIEGDTEYHKRFKELDEDEYEILYDGPYGILVTPKTKRASCVLGRGTKWCTTAEHDNMFDYYNSKAPLYIWKDNTGLYQFWFSKRSQYMDSRDRELSYDKIREMRKKYPPLDILFRNGEEKIKTEPETAFWYAADIIEGRWPDAEPYIMKDPNWAYLYAMEVIEDKWPEAEPYIMKDPERAYEYAKNVIEDRWPEAEPYIIKNPERAYRYARFVARGSCPEVKPYIMKEPKYSYWYAKDVIKDRWPDAEPYIMKDPEWAYLYAEKVIGDRWPEAESYIMKEPEWAYKYVEKVVGDGWTEAEPYIMKSPRWAYRYAKDVIEDRWTEAEPYIMKEPKWSYMYARDVIEGRWPDAEPHIKTDSYWYRKYKSRFHDK